MYYYINNVIEGNTTLDEYKIYKMEGMYFAFSRGKKINFQEEDYLLNDDVIKDYSIDAVETKITELR